MSRPQPSHSGAAPQVYTLQPREPRLWVLAVHASAWLVCVNVGFSVWGYLDQPGKDPQPELAECGFIGLLVATAAYALHFKRSWRLTPAVLLLAAALGFLTGLSAVVLHLLRYGWY